MNVVTLAAHFDGKNICPDEPCELPANTRLRVMVVPESTGPDQQEWWYELGRQSLARAYGDDEPDYCEYLGRMPPE